MIVQAGTWYNCLMSHSSNANDLAAQRLTWPVQVGRVADLEKDEPDLSATTTVEERWGMMWQATQDLWSLRGEPIAEPQLSRHVVAVIRRRG